MLIGKTACSSLLKLLHHTSIAFGGIVRTCTYRNVSPALLEHVHTGMFLLQCQEMVTVIA